MKAHMDDFYSVYVYLALVAVMTAVMVAATWIFPTKKTSPVKFMPYESGIQTETHLLQKRFPLRHYLVALLFLVFDIEVIFLFPWAVIAKELGAFGFYEMAFFLAALMVGFIYVWRKGGLEWE